MLGVRTKKLLWNTVLFTIVLLLSGGTSLAAELNISGNQLPIALGQYLVYLEDAGGSLSIDDIMHQDADWVRSNQTVPTFGLSRSAYWFSITLTADSLTDEKLVLSLDSPSLDRIEIYFIRDDLVSKEVVVGDTIPLSQLELPYRFPIIPFDFNLLSGETQIYFRVSSSSSIEMPLTLTTMNSFLEAQQLSTAVLGAFFSFLFLSLASCSILYYFLGDRQFLGYALFFLAALNYHLAQSGMGRIWLWGETVEFNSRVSFISAVMLIASLSLLGQSLKLKYRHRESLVLVLRFVTGSMLPVALFFILIPLEQINLSSIFPLMLLAITVSLTTLIMAGFAAMQGSRVALYLLVSWGMLILNILYNFTYRFNFVERSLSSSIVQQSLSALVAIMLLLSLIDFVSAKNAGFRRARLETKAKGDFLRNVSREFLTPVHLILANSKRLMAVQSNKLDEPTRKHMATVIKQSDHLHNLINDLLEMAELESDSFQPEFELVEMSHFLNEVKNMLSPSAMEKDLTLTTQFSSESLLLQTDKLRLQHSLINLVANSIKYTDQGNIILGYKAIYFRRRLGIEIFIRDTGRGMSEEFQKRLFQEFSREEDVSGNAPESTGLGLVIVKRIIEKLGGEISFKSKLKTGTEFLIHLPLRVTKS